MAPMPASEAPFPSFTKIWHNSSYPSIDPTRPELSAKGKVVVVTGGAGAIGTATAIGFARAGASAIVLTGRTERTLAAAKDEIKKVVADANVQYYVADITDEKDLSTAMAEVAKNIGPIDVFVNNAGYLSTGPLKETDLDDWWKNFEVNVKGSAIAIRAFIPNAAKAGAALINNTSGVGILPPFVGFSGYQVSKLANSKLFENFQAEHPEFFVLNVQPGVVSSDINRKSGIPSIDTANLPGDFTVWAASPEAKFLKGRYVFCNYDIDELKAHAAEFEEPTLLTLSLEGWTAKGWVPQL